MPWTHGPWYLLWVALFPGRIGVNERSKRTQVFLFLMPGPTAL
jgi:hypothetical protein